MKIIIKKILLLIAEIGVPFTFLSSLWLKFVTKVGNGIFGEKIFMFVGILPVLDHYYQPLINPKKHLNKSLREDRKLPGIYFNVEEQLNLIAKFDYNDELTKFPLEKNREVEFFYNNGSYCSGDAEYLYNIIRYYKPNRIVEIGSGYSTLMAQNAIKKNKHENPSYSCKHICIEPYEMPWLKELDVELIRELVEKTKMDIFEQLEANDILFIDSSHIIRPQGDVLFEFLELLPIIKSGVLVHIHDIFTPKDYLNEWIIKDHKLWNEQYILEAFLTFNSNYRIIGALNYLAHNYGDIFKDKCPIFAVQKDREPGAFWIIRN
jgi:predicted O-methyltransferase YrrM